MADYTSSKTGAQIDTILGGTFSGDVTINALTLGRGGGAISTNTASGYQALLSNTTGSSNTASGYQALRNNTTGIANTASGRNALFSNTTGSSNTASGLYALFSNTTGSANTASGYYALLSNTTGSANTASGYYALFSNTTGNNNIGLGRNANSSTATVSGQCTLGDTNITALRCNDTTISSLSDGRDKTDVVDSPYGLDFVNTLQPKKYKWETRDGNVKDGSSRIGFIAQELLEACNGDNDVLDLVMTDNPDKLEAKYGNLLPVLVQAIKELSAKVSLLETKLGE